MVLIRKASLVLLLGAGALVLVACGAPRRPAPPSSPDSRIESGAAVHGKQSGRKVYQVFGRQYQIRDSSEGYVERGVASWYGRAFHGNPTANGERYDMHKLTAAHKTLPLPTDVEVVNLRNGKRIVVRVNDRGPFVGNRIIDLSFAAAREIDMLEDGTTLVEVRALGGAQTTAAPRSAPVQTVAVASTGGGTPPQAVKATESVTQELAASPPTRTTVQSGPFVQVGAFSDEANAERLRDRLRDGGFDNAEIHRVAGDALFRVRIGPQSDQATYEDTLRRLEQLGIRDTHLVLAD